MSGKGAGFALSWRGGTRLEINQKNAQYEAIQIASDKLAIAIPEYNVCHSSDDSLTALRDPAAVGGHVGEVPGKTNEEGSLVDRQFTKPSATFVNVVRVGF